MKQADRQKMYEQIQKHGDNLNAIFNTGLDAITLCKKLFRLENKAHQMTTDECNRSVDHTDALNKVLSKAKDILGVTDTKLSEAFFINGDCRGYALKIKDSYIREHSLEIHRDMGGYGIIAPDYTPE